MAKKIDIRLDIEIDIEKVYFSFLADGGTQQLSTIIDVDTMDEPMKKILLLEKDNLSDYTDIPKNLRSVKLSIPPTNYYPIGVYFGHHSNNKKLVDVADKKLIDVIYQRVKKYQHELELCSILGEHDERQIKIVNFWLLHLAPIFRSNALDDILDGHN